MMMSLGVLETQGFQQVCWLCCHEIYSFHFAGTAQAAGHKALLVVQRRLLRIILAPINTGCSLCRVSEHGRCHRAPHRGEYSLICFAVRRCAIRNDLLLRQLELDSPRKACGYLCEASDMSTNQQISYWQTDGRSEAIARRSPNFCGGDPPETAWRNSRVIALWLGWSKIGLSAGMCKRRNQICPR